MKLHLLGIPHTVTDDAHHHCAYTAKVQKLPGMMVPLGYDVIHYGVAGAQTAAQTHVDLMTREEQTALRGHDGSDPTKFVGDDGNIGTPLYVEFNRRLRRELRDRVALNDLVLLPFGWGHGSAVEGLPFTMVESGVGYPALYAPAQHRIFESYAWLHYHFGAAKRTGKSYEWVIPNYFDVTQWDVVEESTPDTVVYFGRLTQVKGLDTVVEVAHQRPDLRFVICGQGDPAPYLREPNIEYRPPIIGRDRSALLGHALAVLMPTVYTEPFGGVAVEAQMCGTPVLTPDYGAFTETIEDEVTGFRCHTLGDWLAGLERAGELNRLYIASRARRLYGFERVGWLYDRAFQQIGDLLTGMGWYTTRSPFRAATVPAPALVPAAPLRVSAEEWQKAQTWEKWWWLGENPCRDLDNERRKQEMMLALLEVTAETWKEKSVIDVGGGPISPLLRYVSRERTVLDPLDFGDLYEKAYEAAGIIRFIVPLERVTRRGDYDEVLMLNVLQHTHDPDACVRSALLLAPRVRIFDWCHTPASDGHPHTITVARILAQVDQSVWMVEKNVEGRHEDGTAYCALILQRRAP